MKHIRLKHNLELAPGDRLIEKRTGIEHKIIKINYRPACGSIEWVHTFGAIWNFEAMKKKFKYRAEKARFDKDSIFFFVAKETSKETPQEANQ